MTGPKLEDYRELVGPAFMRRLYIFADMVRGKTLLHINSTATGGGVAEILYRLVPLLRDLGVDTRWEVIKGGERFFHITKGFHNALQGREMKFDREEQKVYLGVNEDNASQISLDADFVVVHDPQPAALINWRPQNGKWLWRCHIDVSHPNQQIWNFLSSHVEKYDASIFSMPKFTKPIPHPQYIIHPSIDPLSEKNRELTEEEIQPILDKYHVPREKPLIVQISRFDKFKDPLGVIEAFKMVRKHNECRLVLAGGGASDDPEGSSVLAEVQERAASDEDIHILLLPNYSDRVINALQRAATIVLQKSVREGFGLTVAEGLWKRKPVIGGAAGGITLQLLDQHTGFLINSVEGLAYRIRYLLHRPELAKKLGETGREHVRRNFLLTRHLMDYLTIMVIMRNKMDKIIYLNGA